MTRKLFSLVLALAVLLGCVPALAAEVTYPLDPIDLTYWCTLHSNAALHISNHDEAESWQAVQEATGVDLTFYHPAAGQEKVDFQLTISDPDSMPDIIQYDNFDTVYEGGLSAAIEDGVILDLTELLPEYAPDYWALVKDNPLFQTGDGKYAAIYKVYTGEPVATWIHIVTRQDYLDEYGKEVPNTIAEMEDYFQWILDNKPGVVPFALPINASSGWFQLTGGFGFQFDWMPDKEGNVEHGYATESYRRYLEVLNRWYEKGYLAKDYTTYVEADYKGGFIAGKYGATIGGSIEYRQLANEAGFKVAKLPYILDEADGMNHFGPLTNPRQGNPAVITSNCKDVEAALKFLNFAFTDEGSTLYNFGVEGKSWNYDENGNKVYTDHMMKNEDGMNLQSVSYILKIHFAPKFMLQDAECNPSTMSGGAEQEAFRVLYTDDPMVDNAYRMPVNLSLTGEETSERANVMTDLLTYAKEQRVLFVNGTRSLDTWDDYIADLNEMGYEDAREITQAAYDRAVGK